MPEPTIVIVEDDRTWRHELALMFTRILNGSTEEVTDYHSGIRTFSTAREAIEYFKRKAGERSNSKPKVDILSLDLNLGRDGGGTGFDVVNHAVLAGQQFATIAISGFAVDDDLHEQLGDKKSHLIELESRIASKTKARCLVQPKYAESLAPISKQVRAIETKLREQVHGNSNVLREWTASLRNTAADLNGKFLCLHFVLPKELMHPSTQDWIPGVLTRTTRPFLSDVGAWKSTFEPLDEYSTASDLLTRLLFLISSGNNYLKGLSLRMNHEILDPDTGRHAVPPAAKEWICPRQGIDSLTGRECFLLTQLTFQRQLERSTDKFVPKAVARSSTGTIDFGKVANRDDAETSELMVSGLLEGQQLTLPDRREKGNGESLAAERYIDGKEVGALKSTRSILNQKLKNILKVEYDLITAVDTPFRTYKLQLPGFVYIQVAES